MFEIVLNLVYLLFGAGFSFYLFAISKKRFSYITIGLLGLSIVLGEAFHIVPRILQYLNVNTLDIYEMLGMGQVISSILMTLAFICFYLVYKLKYQNKTNQGLDIAIYSFAIFKILFSLIDSTDAVLSNNVMIVLMRNSPYFVMAGLLLYVGYSSATKKDNLYVSFLFVYLSISFAAYLVYVDAIKEVKSDFKIVSSFLFVSIVSIIICFFWNFIQDHKAIKKLE